ncbi:hypothetical protein HZB05_00345 [Candidatus Wolfebacteria bacterium]|nr:hypothetical protein [Candidatus Wolfebacteria bacterium]
MKNLFIISAILLTFTIFGCGDPKNDSGNSIPNNCVFLAGGLPSNIPGIWKVGASETSYPNETFTIATDAKGYGDGVCTGDGPCHYPISGREVRWSISGNTITITGGKWYTTDNGQQEFYPFWSYTYYWEIKPSTPNTLTLEYYNKSYNNCTAPFNSTRQ